MAQSSLVGSRVVWVLCSKRCLEAIGHKPQGTERERPTAAHKEPRGTGHGAPTRNGRQRHTWRRASRGNHGALADCSTHAIGHRAATTGYRPGTAHRGTQTQFLEKHSRTPKCKHCFGNYWNWLEQCHEDLTVFHRSCLRIPPQANSQTCCFEVCPTSLQRRGLQKAHPLTLNPSV